jgi:hypothetical protein
MISAAWGLRPFRIPHSGPATQGQRSSGYLPPSSRPKPTLHDWLAFPQGVGLDRLTWGILDHGMVLPDPRGRVHRRGAPATRVQ